MRQQLQALQKEDLAAHEELKQIDATQERLTADFAFGREVLRMLRRIYDYDYDCSRWLNKEYIDAHLRQ